MSPQLPPANSLSLAERLPGAGTGQSEDPPVADGSPAILGPRRRFAESLVLSLRHLRQPGVSKQAFLDEALAAADEYAAALIEEQMRSRYAVRPARKAPGGAA